LRHFYWHNAQWNRSFSSVVWIKASARLHKLCKRMTRVCKSDKFAYFMWFKFLSRFCNKISNSSISYMCFWCVLGRVTGSCSVPTSGKPLRCLFNVYVLNLLTYLRRHLHHCIRYLSMFREDAVAFLLEMAHVTWCCVSACGTPNVQKFEVAPIFRCVLESLGGATSAVQYHVTSRHPTRPHVTQIPEIL